MKSILDGSTRITNIPRMLYSVACDGARDLLNDFAAMQPCTSSRPRLAISLNKIKPTYSPQGDTQRTNGGARTFYALTPHILRTHITCDAPASTPTRHFSRISHKLQLATLHRCPWDDSLSGNEWFMIKPATFSTHDRGRKG